MGNLTKMKPLFIGVFVIITFSLAWAFQLEGWAQSKGRTLTVAVGEDLESLNPYWHNVTTNYAIWQHVAEPLVRYDYDKRRFVGVLAESWTSSEKGWTFKLRRNVNFHDGTELTASDVVYSFKRSLDPKLSRQGTLHGFIEKISAPDKYTFVVTTKIPNVSLLVYINNLFILGERMAKESRDPAEFGGKPIGTGPFRFVEWSRGARVVMDKNPDYWGGPPKIDRII